MSEQQPWCSVEILKSLPGKPRACATLYAWDYSHSRQSLLFVYENNMWIYEGQNAEFVRDDSEAINFCKEHVEQKYADVISGIIEKEVLS